MSLRALSIGWLIKGNGELARGNRFEGGGSVLLSPHGA
jgi:hypothetical protein